MKKNQLLNLSLVICQVLYGLQIVCFLYFTAVLVHWHIDRDYYANTKVISDDNPSALGLGYSVREIYNIDGQPMDKNPFNLNKVKPLSLYFNYLQWFAILLISSFIIREIINLIKSVQQVQTFRVRNIQSFRKIGKRCVFIFFLVGFSQIEFKQASFLTLRIYFTPLLFALAAFVMAEIFKEGNKLYEEEQLTV